jgi:hypothetical protein
MTPLKNIGVWIVFPAVFWMTVVSGIYGCASLGKFTPQGAQVANNAVTVAQGLLAALDGFYGDLLTMKFLPDYTTQAARTLSMADTAATALRQIISGSTVTDAQLNLVAGQVDGARALYQSMAKITLR